MNWMRNIKIIIFDLDGTLYQDDRFLGRYIDKMLVATHSHEERKRLVEYSYQLLSGSLNIKLGSLYDEAFTFFDHQGLKPMQAYDAFGNETAVSKVTGELTYLGDPWSIAVYIGGKEKIQEEQIQKAFLEVRKEMVINHDYLVPVNHEISILLKELSQKKILMTNTEEPSGKEFVEYLNLTNCFDAFYFEGKKPHGMQQLLSELVNEGYRPEEILSIGDNPFNDLYLLKNMGGHTCFISSFDSADCSEWSKRVNTVEELVDFLQLLKATQYMEV